MPDLSDNGQPKANAVSSVLDGSEERVEGQVGTSTHTGGSNLTLTTLLTILVSVLLLRQKLVEYEDTS